jgi:hypothetical protein
MNAPPNQPPGGKPPDGPGQPQMNFDPETGQPLAQPQEQQGGFDPQTGQPLGQPQAPPQQPQAPPQQPQAPPQQPQAPPQQGAPMQQAPQQGAPMQPQAQQPQAQPQPQAQQQYAPPPKKDETLAWVSAGLAAAAWFLGLNLLTAVPAIIVGMMAKKKIKNDPDTYGGETMATVGIVGGAVMTGLVVLGGIVVILMFLVPMCLACTAGVAGSV